MLGMTPLYHRLTRQNVSGMTDICAAIDDQIIGAATLGLAANRGIDEYPLTEVRKHWSDFGTGFRMEPVVPDETHPVFLARRQIFHLLSDPDLDLIGRALTQHRRFHGTSIIDDAAARLSEMIEWQVMRPSHDGGLSLARAASGKVSIVGWARNFVAGPNGAGKIAARIAKTRPSSLGDVNPLGGDSKASLAHFDVEAVQCSGRANEVTQIVLSQAKALRSAPAGTPERLIAEAAVAAESFNVPVLDPADLCAEVAQVLQELVARRPDVALVALSEHIRRQRVNSLSDGCMESRRAADPSEVPEALVRLWSCYSRDDVLTIWSLERSDLWAKLLVLGALASRANGGDTSRRRV